MIEILKRNNFSLDVIKKHPILRNYTMMILKSVGSSIDEQGFYTMINQLRIIFDQIPSQGIGFNEQDLDDIFYCNNYSDYYSMVSYTQD